MDVSHLQIVKEKLVCHAIIGAQRERSLLMAVNIICEFVSPLIQLSTKQLLYRLEKVSGAVLGRLRAPTRGQHVHIFILEAKLIGSLLPSHPARLF